ncbi:MAG: hypothetical protein NXI04_08030 [Planctomycetaceae bacterium]|nr:hypothetical protein [Planctomycetaceae bacterium]
MRRTTAITVFCLTLLNLNQAPLCRADDVVLPPKPDEPPTVSYWYGNEQTFGAAGNSNPLINVLGTIRPASCAANVWYRLNNEKARQLVLGPDLHRLARQGDFNVEIERSRLRPGRNTFQIMLHDLWGRKRVSEMQINFVPGRPWPLPFHVDFAEVDNLQSVVDVIDGKWELTEDGVRTAEPYYDRTFAFGDSGWKDMELHAELIFHRHFVDFKDRLHSGPPYLSHAHASFNMRWAGFPEDGTVPRRAWQDLGCLVALRSDLAQAKKGGYWWMHYGYARRGTKAKRSEMMRDRRFQIELERRYHYRMRVETVADGNARYSARLWKDGEPEPAQWQMVGTDAAETVPGGAIVFVVHHSDVTLCSVEVRKTDAAQQSDTP